MKRKILYLLGLFWGLAISTFASIQVDMKNSVDKGGYYVFPNLTVSGNAADRGYVIRFMFTRPTAAGDMISLPILPGGWSENSNSTSFVRMIDIASGATVADLQNYLRTVQVKFDAGKKGQGLMVLISENSTDAGRQVYYSSDTDHWYEYVQESKSPVDALHPYGVPYEWWEAYNRALDRTFMGMTGYLAVITSALENDFIFTVSSGKMGWIGGARGDIRTVLLPNGKLSGIPSWNGTGNQSGFLGYWYWACGPEWDNGGKNPANTIFYNKATTTAPTVGSISYSFSLWGGGQPDNATNPVGSPEGENYLHLGLGAAKTWNDYGVYGYHPIGPTSASTITGSIIEFQGTMTGASSSGVVGFESSKEASVSGINNNGTSASPVSIVYGDEITYTIKATNTSDNSTAVVVRDTIPSGLEIITSSISSGGTFHSADRVVIWNLTVPTEGVSNVTYKAKPSAGATNLLENKAYVVSNGTLEKMTNSTFHRAQLCNVTFAAGANGTIANGTAQNIDYSLFPLAGVTNTPNTGYSFAGWSYPGYTSLKGVVQPAASNIMDYTTISVLGHMALTANFSLNSYSISYTLNGGTATNPTTYNVHTPTITLNNPTRNGYDFSGWTGSNGSTQQTTVTIPLGSTGNKTYEAHWTAVTYPINYNFNGGNAPSTANKANYKITETPFNIINPPTRDGYDFTGWTGSNGGTPQTTVAIAANTFGNLSYTANWTPKTYTIIYSYGGGVAPGIPNPTTYTITGTPLTISNQPTFTGYRFIGWTGSNGSTPQTTVVVPSNTFGDLTYTANWSLDAYTISYDYNGGVAPATANRASYNVTDIPFSISNPPTRDGYDFDGWTGSNGAIPQTTVHVTGGTGDLSYTANWTPKTYNIAYNFNGGNAPGIPNPSTYTITGTPFTIVNQPTRDGYTFIGWTGSNGSTVQLTVDINGGTFGDLSYVANWSLDTYPISYDYNGGIAPVTANPSDYNITQTPFSISNQPTRNGYSFDGWTGSNGGTPQTTVNVAGGTFGALTYQAQWTAIPFTITYNFNGGTPPGIPNPTTYNITSVPFSIVNEPTKTGHTFVGWTGSNGIIPQKIVQVSGSPMENLTFDAKWSFQFTTDTIFQCSSPVKIESGHDGISYEWILPDGSSKHTADIFTNESGTYILRTNYGSMICADTVYVLIFFDEDVKLKRLSTVDAKVGQPEKFTVTLNPLITNASFSWTIDGGVPSTSSLDTAEVKFNSTGKKNIVVNVTITKGALVCQKTLSYSLDIHATGRGLFVDQHVSGGLKNGSSWQNAFPTLQQALSKASSGDYIWVARGEYKADENSSFFIIHDSVQIYGGFNATEAYLYERNIAQNPTILKGNGRSVVIASNVSEATRLDGFIIEGGSAIANGGGVYNDRSSLTLANCIVRNNRADLGGGIYTELGSPVLYNVEISGNIAKQGAAMYNTSANSQLTNVTVSGNKALNVGGGIYNNNSNPTILNSIIWGNRSDQTADNINNQGSMPAYSRCLIEGSNKSGTNWKDEFGTDLGNNIEGSPLFRKNGFDEKGEMVQGNYNLSAASVAIDRGSNRYVYNIKTRIGINLMSLEGSIDIAGIPNDLAGMERLSNDIVDIGAYEYNASMINPDIQRDVVLPKVDGLVLHPEPGIHVVKGHTNFSFTVTALPGFSLDYLTVKTGMDHYDKEGIFMHKNADGSVTVTIMQVTHSLNIIINGITPVSNETIDDTRVWASDGKIYVNAENKELLRIYSTAGQLCLQQLVTPGMNSFSFEKGVYQIQYGTYTYKVVVK